MVRVLRHSGRDVRRYTVITSLGMVGCQVEVADEGGGTPAAEPDREPVVLAGSDGPQPAAAIARLPESGRGLAIMRACVDNVTLDSSPGRGTVVTMRKHIRWSRDAPLRKLRAAS